MDCVEHTLTDESPKEPLQAQDHVDEEATKQMKEIVGKFSDAVIKREEQTKNNPKTPQP